VLHIAAGITLVQPKVDVPDTHSYAAALGPGVQGQVDVLDERIQQGRGRSQGLPAQAQANVDQLWDQATANLRQAQTSLANRSYYLAATQAFQGAIQAARAENLTAYYEASDPESVVKAALAGCDAAVAQVATVDDVNATDRTTLDSIGAAQVRLVQARSLQQSAHDSYNNAYSYSDWVNALYDAAFCDERAATVSWWADLRDAFPKGPALDDADGFVRDHLDQASEMVLYAEAVLGSASEARARLTEAQTQYAAGHLPGAFVAAVEAETSASVSVQTGGGAPVPSSVLDAAQEGASRAIAALRADGAEPVLAVSLMELASGETPQLQLSGYWEARGLALAESAGEVATHAPEGTTAGSEDASSSAPVEGPGSGMSYAVIGLILGFGAALAVAAIVIVARR
jgi:predicted S18 family serine protease